MLGSNDVRSRLMDTIADKHRGTGTWANYVDHMGDGESGDVIYSCDGDMMRAPYEMGSANGGTTCNIDFDSAEDVQPRTTYETEADEADQYSAMEESFKTANLYTELPLYERFISKDERNSADKGDFAGKGKSFPILKPEDVQAAVHAMGRAGSANYGSSGLKNRIIAIAKRKGWTKYLPKAWRGSTDTSASEADVSRGTPIVAHVGYGTILQLTESAATLEEIKLVEARADYEIKLIAPGKGSSAFYPKEVLQRDGPKVFKAGTHVYLNHPTAAEEASRPEGDVNNLAGVLSTGATYHESHAKGPGLYARMKVFADHAQTVEEKAPHVGMSIRASGMAEAGRMKDGVPVLKELTSAESVDVVTKAGAGGMILTESAHGAQHEQEADSMTLEEAKKLIEAENKPLRDRLIRADAREEAGRLLESMHLPPQAKARIIETACGPRVDLPVKENELDLDKFRESVVNAAKEEARYVASLTGAGRIEGMASESAAPTKEERERLRESAKEDEERYVGVFESLMGDKKAAEIAFKGRVQ